jgi:hypothetical protein
VPIPSSRPIKCVFYDAFWLGFSISITPLVESHHLSRALRESTYIAAYTRTEARRPEVPKCKCYIKHHC